MKFLGNYHSVDFPLLFTSRVDQIRHRLGLIEADGLHLYNPIYLITSSDNGLVIKEGAVFPTLLMRTCGALPKTGLAGSEHGHPKSNCNRY